MSDQITPNEIETKLSAIWRSVLSIDGDFDPDASFFVLGGDSLKSVTLYDSIEDAFGLEAPPEDFFSTPTFTNLVALMTAAGR